MEPAGWAKVDKVRRIRYFSLDGRPVASQADALVAGGCAVELTDIVVDGSCWWTLGFEATGPARALPDAVNASVALTFDRSLPAGVALGSAQSLSYSEWLSSTLPVRLGSG